MKTPFNEEHEARFNLEGLRKLDFHLEHETMIADGVVHHEPSNIIAFDMQCVREGKEPDATNSIKVCAAKDILPEALDLILAAPLLYKSAVRTSEMLDRMISKLARLAIQTGNSAFHKISLDLEQIKQIAINAQVVPVVGRSASMKAKGIEG